MRLLVRASQSLVPHCQLHTAADVPALSIKALLSARVCMQGIYDTLKECACISKSAGGIGLSIHNIRAVGTYIRGTNGTSNGIVPMIRVFNDTARCAAHLMLMGNALKAGACLHMPPV